MIGQAHRFHGQASLRRVYQQGSTIRGQQANAKFLWRDSTKPYRVAVVVSRKVSKSAVVRNRIRRRTYEYIRQRTEPVAGGLDIVITVFSEDIAQQEHHQFSQIIENLLRKIPRTKSEQQHSSSPGHDIVKTD
jgi:ribonuclease P protein component